MKQEHINFLNSAQSLNKLKLKFIIAGPCRNIWFFKTHIPPWEEKKNWTSPISQTDNETCT